MDFQQTGLPKDPTVFKAYKTYLDNVKSLPPELQNGNYAVRVARLLGEATQDNNLVALALLTVMPPATHGILAQRFGEDMPKFLTEAEKHSNTQFAYITAASPAVQKLTLASAAISLEEFREHCERLYPKIEQLRQGIQPTEGFNIPMMQTLAPFAHLAEGLAGKTDTPDLENHFQDTFFRFGTFFERHKEVLASLGAQLPPAEIVEMRDIPTFAQTGLVQDAKVLAAYEMISTDPRVQRPNFEAALEVGKLLSNLPMGMSPTTVAAGIIDVAVMGLNKDDLDLMGARVDWDVVDVLREHSVYDLSLTPRKVMMAPPEFRQILLANAIVTTDNALAAGLGMKEAFSAQTDLPPQVMAGIMAQSLMPLAHMVDNFKALLYPTFGTSDAPELEEKLERKLNTLTQFVRETMPKPPKAPEAGGGFTPGFDTPGL